MKEGSRKSLQSFCECEIVFHFLLLPLVSCDHCFGTLPVYLLKGPRVFISVASLICSPVVSQKLKKRDFGLIVVKEGG